MAYSDDFLNNSESIVIHNEAFLYAIERESYQRPINILIIGNKNGNPTKIWEKNLHDQSTITIMEDSSLQNKNKNNVIFCQLDNKDSVNNALYDRGILFDFVIDSTSKINKWIWPWIKQPGVLICENVSNHHDFLNLSESIFNEDFENDILPVEEILRLTIYGPVVSIEKRLPRVVPYIKMMTGQYSDTISEQEAMSNGVKRVVPN